MVKLNLSLLNLLFLIICSWEIPSSSAAAASAPDELFQALLENSSYKRDLRPPALSPTSVRIQAHFQHFHHLNDMSQELDLELVLRLSWTDGRLEYEELGGNPEFLTLSDSSPLWVPDLYIPNEKRGSVHSILKPNVLVRIHPNGSVLLSLRLSLSLSCPMALEWYPFETHTCTLSFGSYSYKAEELSISWHPHNPLHIPSETVRLSKFKLMPHQVMFRKETTFETGTFQLAVLELSFRRNFGYYFLQLYAPSTLIVLISWLSFWFDVRALEARVSLGVTTVLTMAAQNFNFNQTAPAVSYTKAMDIFTGFSLTLVGLALVEVALVDFTRRQTGLAEVTTAVSIFNLEGGEELRLNARRRAERIDFFSRAIFPILYSGFIILYFGICFTH
jgi:anionic glutamate receptor